ncbi:hypothetical protein N8I77_012067 [Diaporthe amygdali]|uniref:Zn(2)-C6 fungal-type domain-containing protein n=1 Tax=Phomopsis amygdali TaxID=1214568 RepID=A0AAD9S409_PHOAM|nr:hypothetical protein N8I77_012067 [Diaporthe amygdali]
MEPPPSSTSASALGTPGRRRNGRLQACEPCRQRKVSCDHAFPVCRRCRARNKHGGCVYLGVEKTSRKPAQDRPRSSLRAVRSARPSPGSDSGTISPRINVLSDSPDSRPHPSETGPGYLGSTSFSAVYQETQNSLSLVKGPLMGFHTDATAITPVSAIENSDADATTIVLSPRSLETSLIVLHRIPAEDFAISLFEKHINPNDGWIRLGAKRVIEALHSVFGRQLRSRKPRELEELAHLLSSNTAKPWSEDELEAEAWLSSFSGRHMRWESMGILFTYWALAALADHPHRPELRKPDVGPAKLTLVYKEAAELCVELCKGCTPNSLLLYLNYKVAILDSMIAGDAAPSLWRLHGENVALVTYLGLHALQNESPYKPTVAKEVQRRLVSQIFVIDKVSASFSGRPPLLSRKYMLTPLPLDLCDETLLSDRETIAKAVDELDENGWNREGKYYSTTIVRARTKLGRIKDEIMEVALGNPIYTSMDALLALKEHEYTAFAGIPSVLKYSSQAVRDPSIPASEIYTKILIHLEHLQNLFLISRLLVQWGYDSNADLLSVSFEMVSVTLVFWTHMDRLAGLHGDFEWLVMAFAAPSGGVLCNELLKPSLQHTPIQGVTRSGIIQQLSLLSGFLDWVSPSAPNGDLCSSCKAVIQHVLDYALNAPPVEPSSTAPEGAFDLNLDLSSDIDAIDGYFNFDLLNTFHFEAPPLMGGTNEL